MAKVLIIKLGYSETLDAEISRKTSLGDVLRTTVLLHAFKDDHVSWLVDEHAFPLLEGCSHIDRILIYDLATVLQLQEEQFDTVINFEKVPGICALADKIDAWKRYGFRFDKIKGQALAYDNAEKVLSMCLNPDTKKKSNIFWQEALLEMAGKEWHREEYLLGYKPRSKATYDIGFNYLVGSKWPNKAWPLTSWQDLEQKLGDQYKISWQQGSEDLKEYFEWINSCRLIITNDSLGLHIALALKKKVIALFGPTAHKEIYFYDRGCVVLPKEDFDCLPCLSAKCIKKKSCLESITAEQVYKQVKKNLPK